MKHTHCDVGISPSLAAVMATRPTIDYLCNAYDGGGAIRDDLTALSLDGRLPAAVDCPDCQAVAELVHRGKSLRTARRAVRKAIPARP